MKFSLNEHTYLRHAGNETLLWNKRTYACRILKEAQAFLQPIEQGETKVADEIVAEVARNFEMPPQEVSDDVLGFYKELAAATFLKCESAADATALSDSSSDKSAASREEKDDSPFPVGTFYARHSLPNSLHLDLTNACTERCVHCYIADYSPHFLPLDLGTRVLREFREAGGLTAVFSGGECMLHHHFRDFLRCAKSLNLNMIVMSNLTCCDADMIDFLAEVQPQFVNVSLYSMTASEHDTITTIPGSWNKTMNAIAALEKTGVPVRLASPIMRANRHALPGLREYAKAHRMHVIPDCDIFGQEDHDCSNQSCALSPEETKCVWREHADLFAGAPKSLERCAPGAKVCDIGIKGLNISAEGVYYPCDGCHGIELGRAEEQSLAEVWNGEKMQVLRALKNQDFGECAACEYLPWCKVCPTRNYNETGDMFRHAPSRCMTAKIRQKLFGKL